MRNAFEPPPFAFLSGEKFFEIHEFFRKALVKWGAV